MSNDDEGDGSIWLRLLRCQRSEAGSTPVAPAMIVRTLIEKRARGAGSNLVMAKRLAMWCNGSTLLMNLAGGAVRFRTDDCV